MWVPGSLNRHTAPLNRFVLQMVAQGLFPNTKPQPITPIYEPATVLKGQHVIYWRKINVIS